MRKYLAEALKEPEDNKLYIADLHLSIAFFEKAEQLEKDVVTFHQVTVPKIMSGIDITG